MIIDNYYTQIPTSMTDFEDFYRKIAEQLPDDCRIAEVGVADGRSALFMADCLAKLGKKFHLYMIDNLDYGNVDQAVTIVNHIVKSGHSDSITFYHQGSLDSSCKINDGSLDFVFIDASHKYQETKADIRLWIHKLKYDRILAGHDYTSPENPEVRNAVDEVVPNDILNTETTTQGNGVWWFARYTDLKLK